MTPEGYYMLAIMIACITGLLAILYFLFVSNNDKCSRCGKSLSFIDGIPGPVCVNCFINQHKEGGNSGQT